MRKIFVPRLTASAVTVLLTGLLPFPANAGFITFEVPGGNIPPSRQSTTPGR